MESTIETINEAMGLPPLELGKECVGCNEKENLTRCDGTMCQKCWENENMEMPDLADLANDNMNDR